MSAGYDESRVHLFTFLVPGLPHADLAITQSEVVAISGLQDVISIPLTPAYVMGISTWQQEVLTVVDLAAVLSCEDGLSLKPPTSGYYLISRTVGDNGSELLAWPILGNAHVLAAPSEIPLGDLPEELVPNAFHAALLLPEQSLLLLNLRSLATSVF